MPEQADFLDDEIRRRLGQIHDMLVTVARELLQLRGLVEDRYAAREAEAIARKLEDDKATAKE